MNNQNQVGNGGMLASALALAERHPDFARLVVRGAVRSLPLSQGEYYPEGAYPEGPGYWGFGTGAPHPPYLNTHILLSNPFSPWKQHVLSIPLPY